MALVAPHFALDLEAAADHESSVDFDNTTDFDTETVENWDLALVDDPAQYWDECHVVAQVHLEMMEVQFDCDS